MPLVGEPAEVRDAVEEDLSAIKEIHDSRALDYRFPDLLSPLFFVKKVLVLDGKVVGAYCLRAEAEAYLFLKPGKWADKDEKVLAIKALQEAAGKEAKEKGLVNLVAYVPTSIESFFGPVLEKLGWLKDRENFRSWSKVL